MAKPDGGMDCAGDDVTTSPVQRGESVSQVETREASTSGLGESMTDGGGGAGAADRIPQAGAEIEDRGAPMEVEPAAAGPSGEGTPAEEAAEGASAAREGQPGPSGEGTSAGGSAGGRGGGEGGGTREERVEKGGGEGKGGGRGERGSGVAGAPSAGDGGPSRFPDNMVSRMMKQDEDVKNVTAEAAKLMSRAAGLFLESLADASLREMERGKRRKIIQGSDVIHALTGRAAYRICVGTSLSAMREGLRTAAAGGPCA